jgi:hypothetical protein
MAPAAINALSLRLLEILFPNRLSLRVMVVPFRCRSVVDLSMRHDRKAFL